MNNTFDPQVLRDAVIEVQKSNGCEAEVYSSFELSIQIKELLDSMKIKYIMIPDGKQDTIYIMPKRKTKIKYWGGFFNEN